MQIGIPESPDVCLDAKRGEGERRRDEGKERGREEESGERKEEERKRIERLWKAACIHTENNNKASDFPLPHSLVNYQKTT